LGEMGNANVNAFKPPPRKTTLEEVTITVLKSGRSVAFTS
jgi:hypothetical protein